MKTFRILGGLLALYGAVMLVLLATPAKQWALEHSIAHLVSRTDRRVNNTVDGAVDMPLALAGSAVLLTRPSGNDGPSTASADPRPTATVTTTIEAPPASTLPQVVPVPSSAVAPPASVPAATSASAPPSKAGPAKPPPPTKKNPFGVGIVQ